LDGDGAVGQLGHLARLDDHFLRADLARDAFDTHGFSSIGLKILDQAPRKPSTPEGGFDTRERIRQAEARFGIPETGWARKAKSAGESDAFGESLLAAQTERGQDLLITLVVGAGKVIEEFAAARHHAEETAARGNILLVGREVAGQVIDTTGEERDLHIGAARITVMKLETSGGVVGFAH